MRVGVPCLRCAQKLHHPLQAHRLSHPDVCRRSGKCSAPPAEPAPHGPVIATAEPIQLEFLAPPISSEYRPTGK